eukprot:13831009-Ditylum_brightwellii.AAC.1
MSDSDSDNNSIDSIGNCCYDLDFDDDENDLGDIQAIFQAHCQTWSIKLRHQQMNWEEHVQILKYTNDFKGTYRMSIEAFYTLLDAIREDLTLSFVQAACLALGN